jgi:hypothetical protein
VTPTAAVDALRIEPLDRASWLAETARFADHNYRQSWDFGLHSAARVDAVSEHVAIRDGARTVGVADVRVRRVPVVGGGIAYVTGGPLTREGDVHEPSRFLAAVDALRREYAIRRGLVLRVVAPIGPETWNREVAEGLAAAGFARAENTAGYSTLLVRIDAAEADVRRRLHQKWRNCLNRSEREGLTIASAADVAGLERFRDLFDEFVVRKGFDVRLDADFHLRVQRDLPESERFVTLIAEKDGAPVAGLVASMLGDTAVYLLGATSPAALTCKAAYLLQWRAIQEARARGCRWYDLGGIDRVGNPGVFHFKEGLGGDEVVAAGPSEWSSGPRSRLVLALESGRRAVLAAAQTRKRP